MLKRYNKIINIYLKEKRYDAQITVFAALTILLVISLVTVCIRSAGLAVVKADIDRATLVSCESVFAGYCKDVLDEFDIFALKKSDMLDDELKGYLISNSKDIGNSAQLINAEFSDMSAMTDNNGCNFFNEVIDYMDYAIYSQILENINDAKKNTEKSKAVNEITDKITDCQQNLFTQDKYILKLVSITEGIKTNDTGFIVRNSLPVMTGSAYIKQLIKGEFNNNNAAIYNPYVYEVVEKGDMYTDISGLLSGIVDCLVEFEDIVDNEGADEAAALCGPEYTRMYSILKRKLIEVLDASYDGISCISSYEEQAKNNTANIDDCEKILNSKKNIIGEELFNSFLDDINTMKYPDNYITGLCDTEVFKDQINYNIELLEEMTDIIRDIDENLNEDNYNEIRNCIEECMDITDDYSIQALQFDYSDVEFKDDSDGMSDILKLYDILKGTIADIVLDGMDVSKKSIEDIVSVQALTRQSSSVTDTGNKKRTADFFENIKNQALYNEYIFLKFNSFTDYVSDGETVNTDTGKKLDYMNEYILEGNMSDVSNLNSVIVKLSLIRQGADMTCLITNSRMKNEAFIMATALVGFTGNAAVIKAAQYMIMSVWAYAEALMDVRKLCQGQKLELIKNSDSWEISLDKLLGMEWLSKSTGQNNSELQRGLDYEDYLRMLFIMQPQVTKIYRTMSAIEIRMEEIGNTGFRMKDYICSAQCSVEFAINGVKGTYTRKLDYGYS